MLNSPASRSSKVILITAVIVTAVVLIAILASTYTNFLATRVAPGLPFQINRVGEDSTPTLYVNQNNEIEWDTRPNNIARYPAEVISLCPDNHVQLSPDCEILDFHTANDGQTDLFVPPTITPGQYNLLFTAWNTNERIAFSVNNAIQTVVQDSLPAPDDDDEDTPPPASTPNPDDDPDDGTPLPPDTPPIADPPSQPPISSPPPTNTPDPSPNTSLQLIVLNKQPVIDDAVHFSLSNIQPDVIDCLQLEINDQSAFFAGDIPSCD